MSREKTVEEIRDELLDHIWDIIDYWEDENRGDAKTLRGKMEGVAFSILSMLDGSCLDLPAYFVAPATDKEDQDYRISEGEDYYPNNDLVFPVLQADLAGSLHEHFYNRDPKRRKMLSQPQQPCNTSATEAQSACKKPNPSSGV